ncbi:TIGR03943 family putative permease subunit [Gordonia sp. (in: high G+C Gram-positive bacteria)]|uniref:TIGR03943 family putative permease subunit n=1 Tax=Gordonia sp. (in: high G+C Gram-positive bacteria) TaxID=84139 RepID=UPI0039E72B46
MGREAQNLVLLCLGLTVLKTTLDGSYERYVKPGMWPYLLASAVVLVVLAAVAIVRDIRAGGRADDGHVHGRGALLWLLTVPVLVIFFLAPPSISPARAGTTANISAAESVRFEPLPPGPAPAVPILEVVQRAVQPDGGGLSGRAISIDGYLQPRDGHTELAQVVIICCAADARTYRIELGGPAAATLAAAPARTWWRVVGTVADGSASAERKHIPLLQVTDARQVPAPKNTYGY